MRDYSPAEASEELRQLLDFLETSEYNLWILPCNYRYLHTENKLYLEAADGTHGSWLANNLVGKIERGLTEKKSSPGQVFIELPSQNINKIGSSAKPIIDPLFLPPVIAKKPLLMSDAQKYAKQLHLFPTDLTRTPLFLPWARRFLKPSSQTMSGVHETRFGRIEYRGPAMGMLEECLCIFLATRWCANKYQKTKISLNDILDALGYKRDPKGRHQSRNRQTIQDALYRMTMNVFCCTMKSKKTDKKGESESNVTRTLSGVTMLTLLKSIHSNKDNDNDYIEYYFNSEFAESVINGFVTGIDLSLRLSIKGDIAQALERSIRSNKYFHGSANIFELAKTLVLYEHVKFHEKIFDLNVKDEKIERKKYEYVIRRRFKEAVEELIRVEFLTKDSKITGNEIVWFRTNKYKTISGPLVVERIQND